MMRIFLLGLIITSISFSACKKQVEFDKKALLENIITDYVLESYQQVLTETKTLQQAVEKFTASPDLAKLEAAQKAWKNSMEAWSKVEGLYFGPGRNQYRYLQLDNTPIRVHSIEAALADTTTINLNYIRERGSYTKGLAAIEYLLFDSNGGNTVVLQKYQNATQAVRRQAYLFHSVEHAVQLLKALLEEWKNSYAKELASQTDNSSTGGIARFSNVLLHLTQTIARKKVGKPLGKESGSGSVQPQLVESPYAQHSWAIIHYNLLGLQALFGEEEKGMGSYLTYLLGNNTNTQKISQQFKKLVALTKQRPNSLQREVSSQAAAVETIYGELRQLYTLLEENYLPYVSITLLANPDDGD